MKRNISFNELDTPADLGDNIELQNGDQWEVIKCEETGVLMINVDADELMEGDLSFIKALGLTISRPDTDRAVAIQVDENIEGTTAAAVASYLAIEQARQQEEEEARARRRKREQEQEEEERRRRARRDSDSSLFSRGSFGGGSGFGGSFGGFGGGGFSGGGASRGF